MSQLQVFGCTKKRKTLPNRTLHLSFLTLEESEEAAACEVDGWLASDATAEPVESMTGGVVCEKRCSRLIRTTSLGSAGAPDGTALEGPAFALEVPGAAGP